jgi:hypothetical protein
MLDVPRKRTRADKGATTGEPSVNHSIYSANRMTHLKIVVVALIAGSAVASVGIAVHLSSDDGDARIERVIKAGNGRDGLEFERNPPPIIVGKTLRVGTDDRGLMIVELKD